MVENLRPRVRWSVGGRLHDLTSEFSRLVPTEVQCVPVGVVLNGQGRRKLVVDERRRIPAGDVDEGPLAGTHARFFCSCPAPAETAA